MKKTKNEYVYVCDFCSQEFETKKEADKHEDLCLINPKNKIDNNNYWIFLLIVIIILFLVFSVNSNKTQKNNYIKVDYSVATPTPVTSISATPVPIKKTTTNTNKGSQIDCIGPDGVQFKTTMEECKKLNE